MTRTASFTPGEWDAYDRAKIAVQDARGAISLALRLGEEGERAEPGCGRWLGVPIRVRWIACLDGVGGLTGSPRRGRLGDHAAKQAIWGAEPL